MKRKLILAGGRGVLGQLLGRWFVVAGDEVIVLTRRPREGHRPREIAWDGRTCGPWCAELEGATAVLNLAGRSVDCRYHARNRRLILDSRVESTRVLGEAIGRCRQPPRVWLNSSTATIYRHTYGPAWDESGETGATPEAQDAFSIEVAQAWEREFAVASTPETRKVALRTAMVLSPGGGVFPVLRRLVRLGLGGQMAHGRQFMSWIHEEDLARALDWLIQHEEVAGVVNLAAPEPLPNAEVMRRLRKAFHAPFGLPARRWMLEVGAWVLRTEPELIIKSRRVISRRLPAAGFSFLHATFDSAVQDLCGRSAGN